MESLNDSAKLELLRSANAHLSEFFSQFGGRPVIGTWDEVAALMRIEHTLSSVGGILDACVRGQQEPDILDELVCYRENLLRLRQELGRMQQVAASTRARLFVKASHLNHAKIWCATAKGCG